MLIALMLHSVKDLQFVYQVISNPIPAIVIIIHTHIHLSVGHPLLHSDMLSVSRSSPLSFNDQTVGMCSMWNKIVAAASSINVPGAGELPVFWVMKLN